MSSKILEVAGFPDRGVNGEMGLRVDGSVMGECPSSVRPAGEVISCISLPAVEAGLLPLVSLLDLGCSFAAPVPSILGALSWFNRFFFARLLLHHRNANNAANNSNVKSPNPTPRPIYAPLLRPVVLLIVIFPLKSEFPTMVVFGLEGLSVAAVAFIAAVIVEP
jgi:hypothetical protein